MSTQRTIALVQHRDQGSAASNLAQLSSEIRRAAARGADIVVLPELHNGAYFCQVEDPARFDQAEAIDGPTVAALGEAARDGQVVVVGSIFERRAPGLHHNTAVVLERDGALAGFYRKMHIPEDPGYHEKFYFAPGDGDFRPIATSAGNLGVMVCWDQWYPEAARLMALAGADILIYPTAIGWDPTDSDRDQQRQRNAWEVVQRGHAVANGLPLAVCNRIGHERDPAGSAAGQRFWGGSFVAGPQGEILAQAPDGEETLMTAVVDGARTESVRRIWPFLRDRRIDAYGDLTQRMRTE
ncbi:MAG: carbon-nitrogen hydrolase [Pseudomonadota bacterium]